MRSKKTKTICMTKAQFDELIRQAEIETTKKIFTELSESISFTHTILDVCDIIDELANKHGVDAYL